MSQNKSILVIVTSHAEMPNSQKTGLWYEEFAVPAKLFREKGYSITVASIKGGKVPIDPNSMPENNDDAETMQSLSELSQTKKLSELDLSQFDGVFFPGGHGTMFDLPNSKEIANTVTEFLQTDRVVGAVCHGPAALVGASYSDGTPVIKGRKVTGFTNDEEKAAELDEVMPFLLQSKLIELGAEFVPTENWNNNVVVDGNLITGQNPQSSASIAEAILDTLEAG